MKVILYTRVSTDEQAEKGYSLRQQISSLESYCEKNKCEVLRHFQDDFSAKSFTNRPEWTNLMKFVKANKKHVDTILFTKWDRFSRNIEEALKVIRELRAMGINVNSIENPLDQSNPDNKLMLALYLVAPEVENDKKSRDTKVNIVHARQEGAYTSRALIGFRNIRNELGKSTLEAGNHSEMVKEIFMEISQGVASIDAIRMKYREKGFPLSKQGFLNMLRSQVYIGKVFVPPHGKEDGYWVDGLHEGLIDEPTFFNVQRVLAGKAKNTRFPSKRHELLPLRGFIKCPNCSGNLTGSVSHGRSDKYPYYHCRQQCPNRVLAAHAHDDFKGMLRGIQLNGNIQELYKEALKNVIMEHEGDEVKKEESLLNAIKQVELDVETLDDKFIKGGMEADTFNRINKRYNEKLMSLRMELMQLQNPVGLTKHVNNAINLSCNLVSVYEKGDYDTKMLLLGLLFSEKFYLSKGECRTEKSNKVLELLSRVGEDYKGHKKQKANKYVGLSTYAPSAGLEPATL